MVRSFPTRDTSPHNQSISVTFVVAFVAAVVTIVSSLCGSTKKRQRPPSRSRARAPLESEETQTLDVRIEHNTNNVNVNIPRPLDPPPPPRETNINNIKPLPPPPAMAKLRASSFHVQSNSNVSQKGKLSSSMSMRSMGGHKYSSKKEGKHVKNSLSNEDSIWKKTIILGEKCRVPDDEEEAIIYDEKGMRIPTFHRKQSVGLQISRQNSTLESNGN